MKNLHLFLIVILFLIGCQEFKQDNDNASPVAIPSPQSTDLNLNSGYSINPITQDSISPIINSLGDTVLTGKQIIVKSQKIDPLYQPIKSFIHTKISTTPYPEKKKEILVSKLLKTKVITDSLVVRNFSDNLSPFILTNTIGDTVKTNIQIKIEGKEKPYNRTKKINAGIPLKKEEANRNISFLDIEQGMPGSYISELFIDSKGQIWIGTFDDGLAIYDGQTFIHLKEKEGFSDKGVKEIFEDSMNNIWLATKGDGLIRFDGESFTHYNEDNGFLNNNVESICEDQTGQIWVGTYTGLAKIAGKSFTYYTTNEGLSQNIVWDLICDKDGNIWIATLGGGVNCFNGKNFTHFQLKDGLVNDFVWTIIQDNTGALWFGTANGLSRYQNSEFTTYTSINGLNNNYINALYEDNKGALWIGTYGGGIDFLKNNEIQNISTSDGLSNDFIYSIVQDKHKNMWFATFGGGINKYNPNSFNHITQEVELADKVFTTITEDKEGKIWLGSVNGGIQSIKDNKITSYQINQHAGMLLSSFEDHNGDIWFASNNSGIYVYNQSLKGFNHYFFRTTAGSQSVRAIIEDRQYNKWIGTWGSGLYIYDDSTFATITESEGLPSNFIWSLYEDSKGIIWIGSLEGLSAYDPATKSLINYSEKEGLKNSQILNIYEDKSGILWLGTWNGLTKFDGQHFTHFSEVNGLSNERVWSIQEDSINRIWVSTEKGLNMLETSSLGTKIHSFDKADGLLGSDFYLKSVLFDSKHKMWWGNGKSLVQINTNDFYINKEPPICKLTSLNINEQYHSYQTMDSQSGFQFDSVSNFYNVPVGLVLNHDHNHLTFYFTAIDISSPHKIQYSYKINELSSTWSAPTFENKADYKNLPYGDYTFSVSAIGEARIWSTPETYKFSVLPPWWHTWWARVIYGFIFIVLIYTFVNWRLAKLKKRQKELETEVKIATREIVAQKDEILKQKGEVEQQRDIIEEAHKEITDSIAYAKRIQSAILPPLRIVKEYLKDSFILYKPKDVVAGDFYWLEQKDDKILFAAADCTGHGVPGAMVSVVCNNALNRTVREYGLSDPGEILTKTREIVIEEFAKSDEEVKDGMDIALCSIRGNQLEYSGAHNPLWIIRKDALEIEEIKADKQPIGKFDNPKPYKTHTITLNPGDSIYVFSDGFADQFGGEKGKKFKTANFKRLLLSIQQESMDKQLELIDNSFENWKGDLEQLDDVCVIALRY